MNATPLQRRLVVVQGKGGVGRTTLTASIGLAAARLGKRVCVAELSGRDALARLLGFQQAAYGPRQVCGGLDLMCLSPSACLTDFGARKLKISALSKIIFESRLMSGFIEAVPGLQDVVQLGKIEDMLNHPLAGETAYDLVVLDAPATGHGVSLLASARAMKQMTRVGPFHDLAETIEHLLDDVQATAPVLVTLPEALPAKESLDLVRILSKEATTPDAVLLNQVTTAPLPPRPTFPELLEGLHRADAPPPVLKTLRQLAVEAMEVTSRQRSARAILDEGLPEVAGGPLPIVSLPRLETSPRGIDDLEPLVAALTAAWSPS